MKHLILLMPLFLSSCAREPLQPVPDEDKGNQAAEIRRPLPRAQEKINGKKSDENLPPKVEVGFPPAWREKLVFPDWQTSAWAFSPNNKYLVLASRNHSKKNLAVWDLRTGKIIRFFERSRDFENPEVILKLFFLAGGNEFVTLSGFCKTWNVLQSKSVRSFELKSHSNIYPNPSVLSPDGKQLLWAAFGHFENIDVKTGKPVWTIGKMRLSRVRFFPHWKEALVDGTEWDPDSRRDKDYTKVVDINTAKVKPFELPEFGIDGKKALLHFSQTGNLAIICTYFPTRLYLANWDTEKLVSGLEIDSKSFDIRHYCFNRDNTRLYGVGKNLWAWDVKTGKKIWTDPNPGGHAFSADGKYLWFQKQKSERGPPKTFEPGVKSEVRHSYTMGIWDMEQRKKVCDLEYPTNAMVDDPIIRK